MWEEKLLHAHAEEASSGNCYNMHMPSRNTRLFLVLLIALNGAALFLLWHVPLVLAVVSIGIGAVILRIRPRFLLYLVVLIASAALEIAATHSGIWDFGYPTVWMIPIWIPFMYANLITAFFEDPRSV